MTDPVTQLAQAETDAVAARQRLSSTLARLQGRLAPKALAREAAERSGAVAKAGVDGVVRHPGPVAGLSALAGLFLARHRIVALFRRNRDR